MILKGLAALFGLALLSGSEKEEKIKRRYLEPKNVVQKELRDLFHQKFEEQYGKKYGMTLEEANIEKR